MQGFDREVLLSYFAPGGYLERVIPGFKYRQEQVRLAEAVYDAFNNREFLVSEVGTGVGKTFAYLIPAVLWAAETGEKVVISTRTRALQQQIVEKDLPRLLQTVRLPLAYAEAKGRENFLCWNRYLQVIGGRIPLNPEEQDFIQKILRWAENTRSGDRKELKISSQLLRHWHLVAADRRGCAREMCPYHDRCFRLKMMRGLERADLIVTNHAMLLSDVVTENSLLPTYRHLIVDEAHHLDRESFDRLSLRFSYLELLDVLHFLHKGDSQKGGRGYLHRLVSLPAARDEARRCIGMVEDMEDASQKLFAAIGKIGSGGNGGDREHARVVGPEDWQSPWFEESFTAYRCWQDEMQLLLGGLRLLREKLEQEEAVQFNDIIISLQEISDLGFSIWEENPDSEDRLIWLEFEAERAISICASVVGIGQVLRYTIYDKLDTFVAVSATLTVENSFAYFIEKCGLKEFAAEGRLQTLLEHSPFDYDQQARLFAVKDMPHPGDSGFTSAVASVLQDVVGATGGQVLVLFTSRRNLWETAAKLQSIEGIKVLVQERDGESSYLLEEFARGEPAVLMGLETFWEGIDLQGDLLRCVVIVKLPFRSPAEPFSCAGDRLFRQKRLNPFQHFLLPDAAVRFKQGTGRLIRSESDRGAVVVLDSRFSTMQYGQVFKNSIPIQVREEVSRQELRHRLATFFVPPQEPGE